MIVVRVFEKRQKESEHATKFCDPDPDTESLQREISTADDLTRREAWIPVQFLDDKRGVRGTTATSAECAYYTSTVSSDQLIK